MRALRREEIPAELYDEFIGLFEIGELVDATNAAVSNWRMRFPDFPQPYKELKMGPLYLLSEVRQFLRDHPTLGGRPKTVSPEDRQAIRNRVAATGGGSIKALAEEFGISRQTVYVIADDLLFPAES